jgi:hypothetical protein
MKQPTIVVGCFRVFIELPQYDSIFSQILAYSQDFTLAGNAERLLRKIVKDRDNLKA